MDPEDRIIVALDTDANQAREFAQALQGRARWLKVGMTLYYSAGPGIVAEFKEMGYKVFVDLKLHDIPHQVRGAASSVVLAGADMLTMHASGGKAMLQAALEGVEEGKQSARAQGLVSTPICLAITVLTSLDDEVLSSIGVKDSVSTQVQRLALLAQEAGLQGIVCSPQEVSALRQSVESTFALVTPGVRPAGSALDDQARVATPAAAVSSGSDYLVIGRPITAAECPRAAFEAIVEELR